MQRLFNTLAIILSAVTLFADNSKLYSAISINPVIAVDNLSTKSQFVLDRKKPQNYLLLKYGVGHYLKDTNRDATIINKMNAVGKIQLGKKGDVISDTSAFYCSYCVVLDSKTNNMALLHTNNYRNTFVSEIFLQATVEELLNLNYETFSNKKYIKDNLSVAILTPNIDQRSPQVQELLIESCDRIGLKIAEVNTGHQWNGTVKVFVDEQLVVSIKNNGDLYDELVDFQDNKAFKGIHDTSYWVGIQMLFTAV